MQTLTDYAFHEVANIFPMMSDGDEPLIQMTTTPEDDE